MKKLVWIVMLVVVAYLAWRWWRGPSERGDGRSR